MNRTGFGDCKVDRGAYCKTRYLRPCSNGQLGMPGSTHVTRSPPHSTAPTERMSMYADLLRLVLDHDDPATGRSTAELVGEVLNRRTLLGSNPSAPDGATVSIGDALVYDAALVQLCERLNVKHDMTGAQPSSQARRAAEARLAEHLPALAAAFA